jgi:hypothetical protein
MWQVEPCAAPTFDAKNIRRHLQGVWNKVSTQIRLVKDDETCIGSAFQSTVERAS